MVEERWLGEQRLGCLARGGGDGAAVQEGRVRGLVVGGGRGDLPEGRLHRRGHCRGERGATGRVAVVAVMMMARAIAWGWMCTGKDGASDCWQSACAVCVCCARGTSPSVALAAAREGWDGPQTRRGFGRGQKSWLSSSTSVVINTSPSPLLKGLALLTANFYCSPTRALFLFHFTWQ